MGDIKIRRDFGFAGDYTRAMHDILQYGDADDFVVGTGVNRSIEEFCELAFRLVGKDWKDHVLFDANLVRQRDIGSTRADISKIKKLIGWHPLVEFEDLVEMMVCARINVLSSEAQNANPKHATRNSD